ncbi:hypothetical protein HIM_08305 [Hirsutella minnesotensis 3608]|uniref:Uncharacterized protein n=1 Tax=Hirsutella minnesotensis 3608 TaxID=1043627 RepID=A0A0F8A3R0_9HYPO|nr:hypothetical protein HIM_08305 [Hirsutella minnesotensis 3608]
MILRTVATLCLAACASGLRVRGTGDFQVLEGDWAEKAINKIREQKEKGEEPRVEWPEAGINWKNPPGSSSGFSEPTCANNWARCNPTYFLWRQKIIPEYSDQFYQWNLKPECEEAVVSGRKEPLPDWHYGTMAKEIPIDKLPKDVAHCYEKTWTNTTTKVPPKVELSVTVHRDVFLRNEDDATNEVWSTKSTADLDQTTTGWNFLATLSSKLGGTGGLKTGDIGLELAYGYSDQRVKSSTYTEALTYKMMCKPHRNCYIETWTLHATVSGFCSKRAAVDCGGEVDICAWRPRDARSSYAPNIRRHAFDTCAQFDGFVDRECRARYTRRDDPEVAKVAGPSRVECKEFWCRIQDVEPGRYAPDGSPAVECKAKTPIFQKEDKPYFATIFYSTKIPDKARRDEDGKVAPEGIEDFQILKISGRD